MFKAYKWGRLDSDQLTFNLRLNCDEPLNMTVISEECNQEYKTTLHSSPYNNLVENSGFEPESK